MRNPKFIETLVMMAETHDRKNHDYADDENPYSNFEWAAKMADGFTGVDAVFAVLIGVKWARLRELKGKGKNPNNESIEDTQRDIAVYSALWDSYRRTPRVRLARVLRELVGLTRFKKRRKPNGKV